MENLRSDSHLICKKFLLGPAVKWILIICHCIVYSQGLFSADFEDLLKSGDAPARKISIACLELGTCLMHLSQPDSAFRVFERGLSFLDSENPDDERVFNKFRYQMGNCLTLLGNYLAAIKIFREVLENSHTGKIMKGQIFENLGSIYFMKEDYENALIHFQKAFMIKRSLKNNHPDQIEKLLVDIGATCCMMKDYKTALKYYSRAKNLAENSGNKRSFFLARLKTDLGNLYLRMKNPDLALENFFDGLKIYDELDGESEEETVLLMSSIANVHLQQGRFDSALYYLNLPFRSFPVSYLSRRRCLIPVYDLFGTCYEQLGMIEKALSYHDSAWNILYSYSRPPVKSTDHVFFKDIQLTQAFRILENKGRLYYRLSLISENRDDLLRKSFNEYLLAARMISNIDHEFAGAGSRLLFNESSQSVLSGAFETGYQLYTAGYREYINELFELAEGSHGRVLLSSITAGGPLITPDSVRKRFKPEDAMIEYYIGDSSLYIMVLTEEDIVLKKVRIPGDFRNMVLNYYHLLKTAETKQFYIQSRRLYSILVKPVEESLKFKTKLLIIPSPELALIPFETLARDTFLNTVSRNEEKPDWLLLHFDIRYHFSASLWYPDAGKESDEIRKSGFSGFAPMTGRHELRFSVDEVNGIGNLFRVEHLNANVYSGNSATKEILNEQVKKKGIIHIATHSIHDDNLSGCSGLVVNRGNNGCNLNKSAYDVVLPRELGEMKVNADLMVLSACSTGSGHIVPMEGVMSLPRECIYAGAKNIIYTLWNISDRYASRFMQDFYRGILSGMDYASALRNAKISMLNNPETSLPFLWAPYVLLGR